MKILKKYMYPILLFALMFACSTIIHAQHSDLHVMPRKLNFNDKFQRQRTVWVSNYRTQNITIDSIVFDDSKLMLRYNESINFPLTLNQNDSFSFEVLLYNYFDLDENDLEQSVKIFNDGNPAVVELDIGIGSMMQNKLHSKISGTVSDSLNFLSDAIIYFFYNGTVLIDSVKTNSAGFYEKELPTGDYYVAASKEGYYFEYAFGKSSPLEADFIPLTHHSDSEIDFILDKVVVTNSSVSGKIIDDKIDWPLAKKVVVVRKGKHNPTKISAQFAVHSNRSYTTLTDENGNFYVPNIVLTGGYYIQAFADQYIPGYYNDANQHVLLWQNADSVIIDGRISDKNIYLDRDSSYGGGFANGEVYYNNSQNDPVDDAILYAISNTDNRVYSYNYAANNGSFNIHELPYGNYRLVSQSIGIDDAISSNFEISTTQDSVFNITITMIPTSVDKYINELTEYKLYQNYPNPFNPATTIEYYIPKLERVELTIYNALGKQVSTLVNKIQAAGRYKISFSADPFSSGIYFAELKTSQQLQTIKMLLLK